MNEKFTFFWYGPFSQLYPSGFTVEGIKFNCCEQYMMYKKALLFADIIVAKKILAEGNPVKLKKLGRSVKNFDKLRWDAVSREIVFQGNLAKFSQNTDLRNQLFFTKGTTLVEASPFDKIWGVGLASYDSRILSRDTWQGLNWFGKVLTSVRENLTRESTCKPTYL